jgi:hypothetical protein
MMRQTNALLTEDEQIARLWDIENIRHAMNRFCYYLSNEEPRRAIDELWVAEADNRNTASLGYNTGYYIGLDEVSRHLVSDREARLSGNLKARSAADPSIDGSDINRGYGFAAMMTLTTPLIIVADDGRTARFLGYCLGFTTEGKPDDTAESYLTFELILADLILEGDEWRIWHLVFQHDHTIEVGKNYADVPVIGWSDPVIARSGTPTRAQEVYNPLYGWEYIYQDMPRRYPTYTDKTGYGPDGDLGKTYFERDPR